MSTTPTPPDNNDINGTNNPVARLKRWRNHGGAPSPASQGMQERTTKALEEAGDGQCQMLLLAMGAVHPFEQWITKLLVKHWSIVVIHRSLTAPVEFTWNPKIAEMRTSDIYRTDGDVTTVPNEKAKISDRAQHLETWCLRWVASGLSKSPEQGRGRADRIAKQFADGDLETAEKLSRYLLQGAENRAGEDNSPVVLASGLYNALHWDIIVGLEPYFDGNANRRKKFDAIVAQVLACHATVVRVNLPIQARYARSAWHFALRNHRPVTLDEMISAAARVVERAAAQYNMDKGLTFAGIAQRSLETQLKREVHSSRTVAIPEGVAQAIARHQRWVSANPQDASAMTLSEQLTASGVKLSLHSFLAARRSAENTNTLSLHHMSTEGSEEEDGDFAENAVSDNNVHAEQIYGDSPSSASNLLTEGMRALSPLHRFLITCLAPCDATDAAELDWLKHVEVQGVRAIAQAATRKRTGVDPAPVSDLIVTYA